MYSTLETPDQIYKQLFNDVQRSGLFKDSKEFVDAIPKTSPADILDVYQQSYQQHDFCLELFINTYFDFPKSIQIDYQENKHRPIREHIESLWDVLSQNTHDSTVNSSLITLPMPYTVPGGRFREFYYWDSYFTMLGLAASGRIDMLESMVENFAYLVDLLGFIPNGNRNYFCSRSQPPFFALMVKLLSDTKNKKSVYTKFLPQLEKEYQFWMQGETKLLQEGDAYKRVVKIKGEILNRYWDNLDSPRPESYIEDLELAKSSNQSAKSMYRHIRAACESGWDFSSRWCSNKYDILTINTSNIVPIDLNTLIYNLEESLAIAYEIANDRQNQRYYKQRAEKRKHLIQTLFYDNTSKFFSDILLPSGKHSSVSSLASAFPLFFNVATTEQATTVAKKINNDFLKPGGWATTLNYTEQQWDAPNGWAPLQWIVYKGLGNYGFEQLAQQGATRWINNNLHVYHQTGQLLEKYNVENIGLLATGGEYTIQHGFGWTNGVLLQLLNELQIS